MTDDKKNACFIKTNDQYTIDRLLSQGLKQISSSSYEEAIFLVEGKITFDKKMRYVLTDTLFL